MSQLLRIPKRGETWELLELLGRGGSARAWRARRSSPLLEDEVCLKLPLRAYESDERRRLLEEARVLANVRHSHVVSLLEVVEDEHDRPVLVLELVRGTDLSRLSRALAARGQTLSADVVAHVGRALCTALGAAQRAIPGGVVHRDVTPHNVLVSEEGEVKLADFGIARVLERGSWTRSGHVKGKLGYIAPEVVCQDGCDARSDVFSVGVVLFELLTGQRPFRGQDALEILAAIATGDRIPLDRLPHAAPPELVRVVEWMLCHEPSARPDPDAAARSLSQFSYEQRASEVLSRAVRGTRRPGLRRAELREGTARVARR